MAVSVTICDGNPWYLSPPAFGLCQAATHWERQACRSSAKIAPVGPV